MIKNPILWPGGGLVWFAPLEDIARHVRRVVPDGTWMPRSDRLPYYDRPLFFAGVGVLPG